MGSGLPENATGDGTRGSGRPPFPRVRSPFVASAALELEGERSLQNQQKVEQREQPVPGLVLHLGHSPDPNQRVQHEQQPGGQGVQQDQPPHAGLRALPRPRALAPGPGRELRSAPESGNVTAGRPAAAVVPPRTPEPADLERAARPSPKLPENSSQRGESKPSFSRRLGFPGTGAAPPGLWGAILPRSSSASQSREPVAPALYPHPTPRPPWGPPKLPHSAELERGVRWTEGQGAAYPERERGRLCGSSSLHYSPPKCFNNSHRLREQALVVATPGTEERQRIRCSSNFRKEVPAQFEKFELPRTRGNQLHWAF